jgi:2-succinyl-5-enolpyruvyl-6-hydroxy-3-cyclohexene-1-carboxylate synthase
VIVAGAGVDEPAEVLSLAEALDWPVLADPRSGCRVPHANVVSHSDALLRSPDLASRLRPEVVVRLGEPPASKVVAQWLVASGAETVVVDPTGGFADPDRQAAAHIEAPVGGTCRELRSPGWGTAETPPAWIAGWRAADRAAAQALDRWVAATTDASEPAVARRLVQLVEAGAAIVVSSSMPVRDVEWYAPARAGLRVLANRGVNGIDGVVSTAVGVALTGVPTWLLIGDLALLHDSNGLSGVLNRAVRLRVVVVDNRGGGIFSFLPQATKLDRERFERFYGTPQAVALPDLLAMHGIPSRTARTADEMEKALDALAASEEPAEAVVVVTDRPSNVAHHDVLHRQMVEAAEAALAEQI